MNDILGTLNKDDQDSEAPEELDPDDDLEIEVP